MNDERLLSDQDHADLDRCLRRVLLDFKTGKVEELDAILDVAHFIAAVDQRNHGEVKAWLDRTRQRA